MKQIITRHFQSITLALHEIKKDPVDKLIGIVALAFLTCIYSLTIVVNENFKSYQQYFDYPQFMISVDSSATESDISNVKTELIKHSNIISTFTVIDKNDALTAIKNDQELSKLSDDSLNNSIHLPYILIANSKTSNIDDLQKTKMSLEQVSNVTSVKVNLEYAKKINDMITLIAYLTEFIKTFFFITISAIMFNIIRLQLRVKQRSINIAYSLGADASFIIAPAVLYVALQSIFAVLIAIVMNKYLIHAANAQLATLTDLFTTPLVLQGLSFANSIQLMIMVVILNSIMATSVAVLLYIRAK